jgi:anti-sigma B factor antagonist
VSHDGGPALTWSIEPGETSTVVHIVGEIDLSTRSEFQDAVRAGMDSATPVVVVNLGEVAFMGSVGLQVLVQAHDEAQHAGRTVRVVDGSAIVRRIIEVTGLEQVLSVYPTLPDAQSA